MSGMESVPVNRDVAISIMIKAGDAKNIKKLTSTEKRVVAGMLSALRNGTEVKAPSLEILRSIKGKLLEGKQSSTSEKAAKTVKSVLFGVFGNKPRISSSALADKAHETGYHVLAKSYGTDSNFSGRCQDMKNMYKTLLEGYNHGGALEASHYELIALKAAEAEVAKKPNGPEEAYRQTFLAQIQIPRLKEQIRQLDKVKGDLRGKEDTKFTEDWKQKIKDWSDPGLMKDRIDARAGIKSPTMTQNVNWFVDKDPAFPKLQGKMKDTYKRADELDKFAGASLLKEAVTDLRQWMAKASENPSLQQKAFCQVAELACNELNKAAAFLTLNQRQLWNQQVTAWRTLESAGEHVKDLAKSSSTTLRG